MTAAASRFRDTRQTTPVAAACRPASFVQFGVGTPQRREADGTPTWIARGANFVVAVSVIDGEALLGQDAIPDESMLLLPASLSARITADGRTATADEEALAILPPGPAQIALRGSGTVVRIFSSAVTAFAALAANADAYAAPVADTARLSPWPDPEGGFRLRLYALRDHSHDVGFGRLFRSTNLMVNIFHRSAAPRDMGQLSPHDHQDFEQGSLTLEGDFSHFLRTPWGRDQTQWRPDQRIDCSGCSLVVIPPRMIHTTSWSGAGARLVDIFAPPRHDFSAKPGWVRNADDYPVPAKAPPPAAPA